MQNHSTIPKDVQPSYYHIPFEVASQCTPHEAYVWAVIYMFTNARDKRCYASNETIASALPTKSTVRSVQNALLSLEEKGLLFRVFVDEGRKQRSEIQCHLSVSPTGDTVSPTGDTEVSPTGDQSTMKGENEKKVLVTCNATALRDTSTSNGESVNDGNQALIVAIIDRFVVFNKACKSHYGNKTQRKACQQLLDEHGLDRVLHAIEYVERSRGEPFCPTITTPLQLWEKWSALEAFGAKRAKGNQKYAGTVGVI